MGIGMSLRANEPGQLEQNLNAEKVNRVEDLLNSVDFTTMGAVCGRKLRQKRIRFTNGKYEEIIEQDYDVAEMANTGGGAFPWGEACLGYEIVGSSWVAKSGFLYRGARAEVTIAELELDFLTLNGGNPLANGNWYIYVEGNLNAGTAAWANPSTTVVLSDDATYRKWFYIASWTNPILIRKPVAGIGFMNIELEAVGG